jgi:DNA repair exonuclease SbcCD ATPase subunit
MSEPVVDPAQNSPADPPKPAKPSLEDSLASLDEQTRAFVLGEVQSARTEAKNLRERVKEAEPIVQQWKALEESTKSEVERERENSTRWQSRTQTLQSKLVSSQVQMLAAQDFVDPSDALAALGDPSKYLGAEDEINEDAIKADLTALLERKPHWRRAADQAAAAPRIPAPNPAQGSGVNGKPAANPAAEFGALIQGLLK